MSRPSVEEIMLKTATAWAERGTCSRLQVGAVAAVNERIVSTGFNGSPAGMPHCEHKRFVITPEITASRMNWHYWGEWPDWIDINWLDKNEYRPRVNDILRLDNGTLTITQADAVSAASSACTWAVHAEANVINFAARYGIALEGATIYTTDTPCVSCAGSLINTGIVRVVAGREYRDLAGTQLLRDAGIPVVTWVGDPWA